MTEHAQATAAGVEDIQSVESTTCCVVGGGPAGVILSLLLARQGVAVMLLESHKDFDRDFRGDTVHPSTLEILDQLGLADRMLAAIPHGRVRSMTVSTAEGSTEMVNLGGLKTKYPYIAMLPQVRFLEFLVEEAKRYPSFDLRLGANVQRLVEEDGIVRGVRYRGADSAWHEVRAELTVAADGRFSKVRSLVGFEPVKTAPPMDVIWLRLPRRDGDPVDSGTFYVHEGHFAIALDRGDQWQVGYIILKGSFQQIRGGGIEALRQALRGLVPWLGDRVDAIEDWKQLTVLNVESSRLTQWYKPGLLLIGDAAHVMSPVGGVGINYAVQDAVETSNMLGPLLKKGHVAVSDLAALQHRRELPVRVIQAFQAQLQKKIAAPALQGRTFRVPLLLRVLRRLPVLRNLPGRMIAFGIRRVRVKT